MVPSKLLLNEQMNVALSFYSHDIYYYGSYTFFFFLVCMWLFASMPTLPIMMVHFMFQLDWAKGHPDSWRNIISECFYEYVYKRD